MNYPQSQHQKERQLEIILMKLQDKSSQIDVDLILKHHGYTHFKGSPLDDDGSAFWNWEKNMLGEA